MTRLRALQGENTRREKGLFVVEEAELVRRSFALDARVENVILSDVFAASAEGQHLAALAESKGLEAFFASSGLLGKMLGAKPVPDCVAIVASTLSSLPAILDRPRPLIQLVEHCESADNLGMLLRSTDAAGVDGVILAAHTTDPFSRRAVRGSRGAVLSVPLCIAGSVENIFKEAKRRRIQIVATSATASTGYADIDYTKPTMIAVGNEHTGLSPQARDMADLTVRIPMLGKIHSLNIAVAASVVLYEAVRQRESRRSKAG